MVFWKKKTDTDFQTLLEELMKKALVMLLFLLPTTLNAGQFVLGNHLLEGCESDNTLA